MTTNPGKFITKSPDETFSLGRRLGQLLKSNQIIAISGQLGAGKTVFIKGVASGLNISDFVSSPSFIIINEYSGSIPLFHVDLYRLESDADIEELDMESYFGRGGVVAIEWAEKMEKSLPENILKINICRVSDSEREIIFTEKISSNIINKLFKGKE